MSDQRFNRKRARQGPEQDVRSGPEPGEGEREPELRPGAGADPVAGQPRPVNAAAGSAAGLRWVLHVSDDEITWRAPR